MLRPIVSPLAQAVGHFVIEDLRRDFRFWHKADIAGFTNEDPLC
jgi:hypothetical protein